MSNLSCLFLGVPQILLDGEPVTFESRKATALLAYLALCGGRLPRDDVAALLWPESDRTRARGALRYTLSLLRKTLGDGWLRADRSSVGLQDRPDLHVDVLRFRHLLAAAGDDAQPPTPAHAALLGEAVALYRGDFLQGFSLRDSANFDEWQFYQTEALRQELAGTLQRLVRHYRARDEFEPAIAHAQRWLHLDPLRETVQRTLIQLYADAGQPAAALRQYAECARLLDAELGVVPSPQTVALQAHIRNQLHGRPAPAPDAAAPTPSPRPCNLHAPLLPLLGRDAELTHVQSLLLEEAECRLLTLTGPGGIGKTRLAQAVTVAVANRPGAHFRHGVYYLAVASVSDVDALFAAIADAVHLPLSGHADPQEQVVNYLRDKSVLLVLDNFDALIHAAQVLVDALQVSPALKILITSRERLHLYEEWLYDVAGLSFPETDADEDAAQCGAVQLFAQRARRMDPHFALQSELDAIVQICRLLNGMPLGIELAAGWVRTLSCREIVGQIQNGLAFLSTTVQNIPERHRSLYAAFDQSWQRLAADEQAVFARLAVFAGSFSRAAAESVAGATLSGLAALVDKSLVQRIAPVPSSAPNDSPPAAERYQLHELLRHYAEGKLTESTATAARIAHCRYYAAFLQARAAVMLSADERQAIADLQVELENIRAAWHWLVSLVSDGTTEEMPAAHVPELFMQIAPTLAHVYQQQSRYRAGVQLFERAVAAMDKVAWRATCPAEETCSAEEVMLRQLALAVVRTHLATLTFGLSQYGTVRDLLAASIPVLRQRDARRELAEALAVLGKTAVRTGNYAEAAAHLNESLAIGRAVGDARVLTEALNGLGMVCAGQGRYAQSIAWYHECLAIFRTAGYARGISRCLNNLGTTHARSGNHAKAARLYAEAYAIAEREREPLLMMVLLSNLGSTERQRGDLIAAESYYRQSLERARDLGERRWTVVNRNGLGATLSDAGDPAAAVPYLYAALAEALTIQTVPDLLDSLAGIGCALARHGDGGTAAAVLHTVIQHPLSKEIAVRDSQRALDALAENAAAPAEAHDLDAIIALVQRPEIRTQLETPVVQQISG